VDRDGNAIVVDGWDGSIKIFAGDGTFLSSFPLHRPESVGVLSDGRILVSGFPTNSLISVFDRQGRLLGGIGEPVKVEDDTFKNSMFNQGSIVVDKFTTSFATCSPRRSANIHRRESSLRSGICKVAM